MPREGRGKSLLLRCCVAAWAFATIAVALSAASAGKPQTVEDRIAYGSERKAQMAAYSRRHYGTREWRLRDADAIVLHYTASDSYSAAWNTFESNAPNRGELPGVCAHYVVKQSGTIAEVVPPTIRCRHAVGINHRSIGIEMVQEAGRGSHWADQQILQRRPQIGAALRLVRWLQGRFEIATRDVIGHSMVNESRYFKDLQGWRNDHTDWLARDVREFRDRLERRGGRSHP
jgi:N-acetyl-anhydromuramyl-L-alanine amidase AmpD